MNELQIELIVIVGFCCQLKAEPIPVTWSLENNKKKASDCFGENKITFITISSTNLGIVKQKFHVKRNRECECEGQNLLWKEKLFHQTVKIKLINFYSSSAIWPRHCGES